MSSSSSQPLPKMRNPYKIHASFTSPKTDTFRFVSFAPWTSETLERRNIPEISITPLDKAWKALVDNWGGVVAIVSSNTVTFLRIRDNEPHQFIHVITELPPSEERGGLYTLCWTYDPIRLVPFVAFAGKSHLIYVWSLTCIGGKYSSQRFRVLRGHGEEIYALKFHHEFPHILASASRDTTVRIWNVFASESNPEAYRVSAMGIGDEGPVLVAILAGGTVGGHVQGVTALDFHPNLPVIATGGADQTLKIWPLPRFPPLHPGHIPDKPHRTYKCFHPLFSTSLIHTGIINGVSWHDEDTLLSYTDYPHSKVVKWRWLGLHHHFPLKAGTDERLVRYGDSGKEKDAVRSQRSQYDISYSFHILTTYYPPSSTSNTRSASQIASFSAASTSGCSSPLQPSWTNYSHFHDPSSYFSSSPNNTFPSLFLMPIPPTSASSPAIAIFHPDEPLPPRTDPIVKPKVAFAPENHDEDEDDESQEEQEELSPPITRPHHRENVRLPSSSPSKGKGRETDSTINVFPRRKEDDENEAELRKWIRDAEGTTRWVLKAYAVLAPPVYDSPSPSEDVEMDVELDSQEVERRRNSPRKKTQQQQQQQQPVVQAEEQGARLGKGKNSRRVVSDGEEGEEAGEAGTERERKERKRLDKMRVRGVATSMDAGAGWVVGVGERKIWIWRREEEE